MQPSIYKYLDYRQYLRDVIAHKRETSPTFSLEQLGRKTGCLTKSHISLIVSGKRTLTSTRAAALGKALGVSDREMPYYQKLIQFNQAKDGTEKENFLNELMSHRGRSLEANLNMQAYQVLEEWHGLAIRELARMPNFDPNPQALSARFRGLLSPIQARRAVKLLIEANLLTVDEDGNIRATSVALRTTDEINSVAIRRYHKSCLDLGKRIIETEPLNEREFGSVNLVLRHEDIPKVKDLIKNLRENVLALAQEIPTNESAVAQINIQMFQLSH